MSSVHNPAKAHICYFCSAHERFDTRVFAKYCLTTIGAGHRTSLVVADGLGNEVSHGVEITDVGMPEGSGTLMRLKRFLLTTTRVYLSARRTRADIYHFHDPELLPYSFLLALTGKPVIYDVHEDYKDLFRTRSWMWGGLGPALGVALRVLEKMAGRFWLRRIVTATERIEGFFPAKKALTIRNYTDINEFPDPRINRPVRPEEPFKVCLIGGLMPTRGVHDIVRAIGNCKENVRLVLGGPFEPEGFKEQCMALPGWDRTYHIPGGWISRTEVSKAMQDSDAGIIMYRPEEHLMEVLPVKLFEYMAAGLPCIVANFPVMEKLVISKGVGLMCDPLDPEAIAGCIDELAADRDRAMQMGRRSRELATTTYSWQGEARRLLEMYAELVPPAKVEQTRKPTQETG